MAVSWLVWVDGRTVPWLVWVDATAVPWLVWVDVKAVPWLVWVDVMAVPWLLWVHGKTVSWLIWVDGRTILARWGGRDGCALACLGGCDDCILAHLGGREDCILALAHCPSHGSGTDCHCILPGEPLVLEFRSSLVQMRAAMKSCDGKDCGPEAPLLLLSPQQDPTVLAVRENRGKGPLSSCGWGG